MALKEKAKPERVSELVDMARRRARQSHPQWVSGLQLIGLGIFLSLLAGVFFLVLNTGIASGSPGQGFFAFASLVTSTAGGLSLLAGIIRWGVQPVIYYQEKLLEKLQRKDESEPPV